ncbi:MAG: hypothetical protein ACYDAC_12395 [Candidatus Dormibacteria bacterium]
MSRWGALAVAAAVVSAACGPAPASPSGSPRVSASATASAAAGPCASVRVTTAIAEVPPACAALWAPYGVTKVPPVDLLQGTPTPPPVIDETNGAVPQATADAWALALNHAGMWSQWSEANLQYQLTLHIEGPQVVNVQIDQLLRAGTAVIDPPCDEFGVSYHLRPVDADLSRFLQQYGERTAGRYAFVLDLPGPCVIEMAKPDGSRQNLYSAPGPLTSLVAGRLVSDAQLGTLWFVDAGGLCTRPGAPSSWCSP